MELEFRELDEKIRLIKLIGRMDLAAAETIEAEFTARCSGAGARVLVDLGEVDFIASTGIRLLLNTAKSVSARGGKMGFLNPSEGMREVLDVIGVFDVIPAFKDMAAARAALLAP
jgi:anti-anti-sigma factor